MTLSLKHAFTSAKSDGGDATLVRPSNWNAEHTMTAAALSVIARAGNTSGDVADLAATTAGQVLYYNGTALVFSAAPSAAGRQEVSLDASIMIPRLTNGATRGYNELTTNKVNYESLRFDQTTRQYAQFKWRMPPSWDEGTVSFMPLWTTTTGTSGGVTFGLAGVAVSNGETMDSGFGTAQLSQDTFIATAYQHLGPESSAITIAGSPAAGDLVLFQIDRTVADSNDTFGYPVNLLGIVLVLNMTAGNDG